MQSMSAGHGGMMSYGTDSVSAWQQAATYVRWLATVSHTILTWRANPEILSRARRMVACIQAS